MKPSGALSSVMHRNIQELFAMRREHQLRRSRQQRVIDALTRFAGSPWCLYVHALILAIWFAVNSNVYPGLKPFDPYPFMALAMALSVEAIFLSSLVLITQNRMGFISEQRADLDLQINLLSEHEITRLLALTEKIALKMGIDTNAQELNELKRDVEPMQVLAELEKAENQKDEPV